MASMGKQDCAGVVLNRHGHLIRARRAPARSSGTLVIVLPSGRRHGIDLVIQLFAGVGEVLKREAISAVDEV